MNDKSIGVAKGTKWLIVSITIAITILMPSLFLLFELQTQPISSVDLGILIAMLICGISLTAIFFFGIVVKSDNK